jgi:hypothetical protein
MNTRTRRTLIVSGSLLVAVATAFVAWSSAFSNPQTSANAPSSAEKTAPTPSANAAPTPGTSASPTPRASVPSPTKPSAVSSTTPAPKGPSPVPVSGPAHIGVVTTFAGWNTTASAVEVGGYANVVEPVGTCTLRLIHGDKVVTLKHTATADATTVACGGFSVPGSQLSAGDWQTVLAYSSPKSAGQAAAVTVKVP